MAWYGIAKHWHSNAAHSMASAPLQANQVSWHAMADFDSVQSPSHAMAGSEEEQAQRALAALIAGLLLNSVHPDAIAQRAPQPALACHNSSGRELLAAAVRTIWPPPPPTVVQLLARGWVPAPPGAASSPAAAAGSDHGAPATEFMRGLDTLLQRHSSDVSLTALHHSCLVACVAQRRLKLEEEDNTSPAWQAELKHCLLEAQLLLELAPDEPHHYLAASHFLEHAEFLDREGRAAALRLTLRGAKVAKQCKGEWPDWVGGHQLA